ncbi:MAG: glycoside hydrolase family 3 C-terminal domain-containing protein, partial [Clostridiales bacterium]|nr:glycoside hydrolase family 3 C-terminal domain-containing protein [Clostridiales bacterium]
DNDTARAAPSAAEDGRQFALLTSQESTVLLKNDSGTLPIVHAVKLATFGQIAHEYPDFDYAVKNICHQRGCTYLGHADGYAIDAERSDELLSSVEELAKSADVVIAFVGLGARRESKLSEAKSIKLPANQRALIASLEKSGKTVIAVAAGGVLPDVATCGAPHALLFAPCGGCRGAEAVFNILFGVVSPSGRLAFTAYKGADEAFARQKAEVAAGRYKIGEFVGYRRYATENVNVGYPFGHGLTYADFAYSNLKINGDSVEVTVRNNGERAGVEVAQMYVGKRNSAIVTPSRELKGFAKVMIAPHSAVQITFPLNAAMLEKYDVSDGTRKTESGVYDVFVGASAMDIRLKGEINIAGAQFAPSGEKLSDYLPAFSNIAADGYKLNSVAKSATEQSGNFKSARPSESFSYERLFADEFGDDETEENYADETDGDDISSYLDDGVTVKTIADGLIAYALSNGYKFDGDSARELIGAMSATRAVLLDCDTETFAKITETLCGYFGCPAFSDDISDCEDSDGLFRDGAEVGLTAAIGYAASRRDAVAVVALNGVTPSRLGSVFAPFIRYSTAPENTTVTFGAAKRILEVTPNIWFLMRLADGQNEFPAYVADMASVVSLKIEPAKKPEASDVVAPNYY